jgi:hypothetical protein
VNGDRGGAWVGIAFGGLAPIVAAALLVPLRDELVPTNLALILVIVVVLAAILGGRAAGATAAVSAAASFDFFLTRPYLTLRIDSADDLETAALLLVTGLIVGQLSLVSTRYRHRARAGEAEIERIHKVVDLMARGADPSDVVRAARDELTGLLDLRTCRFEAVPVGLPLPRLERSGSVSGRAAWRLTSGEFELPAEGAELPVLSQGQQVGRFVLEPSSGRGVSLEARVAAVAIADQVGAALIGMDAEQVRGLSEAASAADA